MSHFTDINLEIRNEAALLAACAELGLQVARNAQARGYGNQSKTGQIVIKLDGPYDIAVNKTAENSFTLTTDFYQGHVERQVGPCCSRLIGLSGVHHATALARKRGLAVRRIAKPDGNIRLSITGRALELA